MKILFTSIAAAALLSLSSCGNAEKEQAATEPVKSDTVSADATNVADVPETPPMDSAAMAKAWENYMMPAEMHKWMASQDGKWKGEMISYDGPEGKASAPSELTQENKMLMGGRYQESICKGKMMGMDFEGHSLLAYDNAKKKFVNIWIDNMGTGVMMMEGLLNEATKSLELKGTMTDPSTGKDTPVRQVFTMKDDKTQTMEMYCRQGGKEVKMMELKLAKK